MDAFQILVIILAVFLAIFLILGIVLLALAIKISRHIKNIAENIDDASNSVSDFLNTINRLTSPAVIAGLVIKYIRGYISRKRSAHDE